jgi:hypothetical protein
MSSKKSKRSYKKSRRSASGRNVSNLPLLVVLGGILLAGAALFAFWKAQNPAQSVPVKVSGQPSLKVDRDFVDYGNVHLGKVISVAFNIANVGDKTLRFNEKPYVEVVEGC